MARWARLGAESRVCSWAASLLDLFKLQGKNWVALCPLYLIYPIQWSLNARCPAGHPDPGTNRQSPKPLTAPGLELFEGELLGEEFLNKPIIRQGRTAQSGV